MLRRIAMPMLALLACCAVWPARAQQIPPHSYGQLEGLGNLMVTALAQDGAGYLWVGTANGLYRFDGERFHRFEAPGAVSAAFVRALHADRAGNVWVGTIRGLCRIDGERCPPVLAEDGRPLPIELGQGLASFDDMQLLAVSGGQLWRVQARPAGRWRARPFFTGAAGLRHPAIRHVTSVVAGRGADFWMGCGPDICHYHRGELVVYGQARGLPKGAVTWHAMLLDAKGELWCRSRDGKMLSLPPGGARFVERRPPQVRLRPALDPVLARDRAGRLLTSSNFGLVRGRPGDWQTIGGGQGLNPDDEVSALLTDRDGDVWIGIAGRGLRHWQGYRDWENWGRQQGLPSGTVWSVLRDRDGAILAGTGLGMAVLAPGAHRFSPPKDASSGKGLQWSSMVEDRAGNVWGGTFAGSVLRKRRGGARFGAVATLPPIFALMLDEAGRVWISTKRGLYVIADPAGGGAPRRVALDHVAPAGGRLGLRGACQTPGGALWFVADGALLRLAGGNWSRAALALPADHELDDLVCDGDRLWFTLMDRPGVWQVEADAGAARLAPRLFDLAHTPLRGQDVQSMWVDNRRWLWLGTDSGLGVWNGSAWRLLNQQSGMVWNDTNQKAYYEDGDGSLWIGTGNGISHLLRPQDVFAQRPLRVLIEKVSLDGVPRPAAPFSVPWTRGALTVKLAVLSFHNHDALRFRYRLLGLESEWSSTELTQLRYSALPPGDYVLQVMANNIVSQARSALVELPFSVTPPWWRTPWCYAASLLLAGAAAAALWRWRVRQLLRRRGEMEALIRERTLELEASREEHRQRSMTDSLTQVWNRAAIMDLIARQIAESRQGGTPFLLALLDLDHFKRINDTHGHLAGDAVLKEFVRRTQQRLRGGDALGRYGGEEFLLLLPGLDAEGGRKRLGQLHQEVCATAIAIAGDHSIAVTCSFGVVDGGVDATPESLIGLADLALYRAKENGRNRIEYG